MADTLVESTPPTGPDTSIRAYRSFWFLIAAGWFFTNVGYSVSDLPLRFLLKDELNIDQTKLSMFFLISQFTNYIKPLAGILTDAIPIFGTRRRHYVLIGFFMCGVMWGVMTIVPATYLSLIITYSIVHVFIVLISTTLGGLMVEGGARFRATGRLSAQRIGIFRIVQAFGGPVGGFFAQQRWYYPTFWMCAIFHFLLIPFYWKLKDEEQDSGGLSPRMRLDENLAAVKRQWKVLISSKQLWAAAGLVFLVIAEPGFGTPLLYYQTDTLRFSKDFVGNLALVTAGGGVLGAFIFSFLCRRVPLRPLVAVGILFHVAGALCFLFYKSPTSAIIITGTYWCAQTLALLPLYDMAMRATPRGSEALGYSVMMSVWNLTDKLSDLVGTLVTKSLGFPTLICINAGLTACVLIFVPLLPAALMRSKDAEPIWGSP